jgi:hypothetical protein
MAEIQDATALRHPLPFAFGVAADAMRWPAFWPFCRAVSWIERQGEEGLLAIDLTAGPLRRLSLRGRLSLAPGWIRFHSEAPLNLWLDLTLVDDGGGTLVELRASSPPDGGFGLIGPGAVWRRATAELLPALRKRLDDLAWSPARAGEHPPPMLLRLARG